MIDLHQRSAGVLLHVTSLPGPHGIGDFGPDAYRFVDWLASCGQRLWQWLPATLVCHKLQRTHLSLSALAVLLRSCGGTASRYPIGSSLRHDFS